MAELDVPVIEPLDPEVEELWSSRALLLVLLLLILSFWTSYYLKVRKIKSIHETIVALFAGAQAAGRSVSTIHTKLTHVPRHVCWVMHTSAARRCRARHASLQGLPRSDTSRET